MKRIIKKILSKLRRPQYRRGDFGSIGPHTVIGRDSALVPHNMYLDDYVVIQNKTNFISYRGKLVVKKYSVISSGCIIVPSTHLAAVGLPFYFQTIGHYGDEDHTIVIDEDCWIGAGSILLPNCRLGRGCVVAAGSVVTKPVPPYAIVGGAPARVIGVKFSKEDILRHESIIYPPEERMSETDLDALFLKEYADMKPMRQCPQAERQSALDEIRKNYPYTIYSVD